MKAMMKVVGIVALAMLPKATSALPMDYTFDVDFVTGALAGTSAPVFVTLDGVQGVGFEVFTPILAPDFRQLLAFEFTFGGISFSIADDTLGPGFPSVTTFGGALNDVIYRAEDTAASVTMRLFSATVSLVTFFETSSGNSAGFVDAGSWRTVSAGVPAPATLALFGIGLAGLGWSRRKKV